MKLFSEVNWGSILWRRYLHAVGSGKLVRAIPRVCVESVMVVLSGQRSENLSVASEAWNFF